MAKIRRKFTPEEKYSILQEAEQEGSTEICRKYNLAFSVLSYWKKKYLSKGKEGLKAHLISEWTLRYGSWKKRIFA